MKWTVLLMVALLASRTMAQAPPEALIAGGEQRIAQFSAQLKSELLGAIGKGGLAAAVDVCHQRAPVIARQLSTDGWLIGRTSHKTRNPDNAPDAWENRVLQDFLQQSPQQWRQATLIDGRFRMMKGIPTGQLCMQCHGRSIAPEVQQAIARHYPLDQATGFQPGELRGAFTLTFTPVE
ncbi:DUF3365 domain-containing protein [Aestuariibacter halophilus]|uniref:DUF3365 domain-containing protein n=1 Tax=Fluctibacter halophilus TaxID=226011 RepID=A0ABS8GBP1_9ALTE|nr:DUF3365 domain-containing protein [Aestuariibacter halophilus]MCC2617923.1 DUF3365 domain-containing protein [Aestuariibacter halophilus]